MPDLRLPVATLIAGATLLCANAQTPPAPPIPGADNAQTKPAPPPQTDGATTPAPKSTTPPAAGKATGKANGDSTAQTQGTTTSPKTPGDSIGKPGTQANDTAGKAKPEPAGAPSPAPPTVNVTVQAPSAEPPKSDLISGWIGLAILGAAGFFGWKALAKRGVTVAGALSKLGIEETTPAPPSKPLSTSPNGPAAPPLPSLADLPAPPSQSAPSSTPTPAQLVGVAGANAGVGNRLSPGLTIGRDPGNGMVLADDSVSRRHAQVSWSDAAGWVVSDLGSSNGTFLNDRKVADPVALRNGDQVRFGESRFRFEEKTP